MSAINLDELARLARDAGIGPVEFVRRCFESPPVRLKGDGRPDFARVPAPPAPLAPVPFPNIAPLQAAAGKFPEAANRFGIPPVPQGSDEQLDVLFNKMRAAILQQTGRHATANEADVWTQRTQQGMDLADKYFDSTKEYLTSRRDALKLLLDGLRGAYHQDCRSALEIIVRQAERTFEWRTHQAGQGLQSMAELVFDLGRGAMRSYAMSPEVVARTLAEMASMIPIVGCVLAVVIVGIYVVGSSNLIAGSIVVLIRHANPTAVVLALTSAMHCNCNLDSILRPPWDFSLSRVEWIENVCEAWGRGATRRLGDLAEALRNRTLTCTEVAVVVIKKCQASHVDVVDALIATFGRDAHQLARALREAHVSVTEIAYLLRSRLGIDAIALARVLKDVGWGARETASALRAATFAALDVARALRECFGLGRDEVNRELANAGFDAGEIVEALSELFRTAADTAHVAGSRLFR